MVYKINKETLSAIADKIRKKTNSTAKMLPGEFPAAIEEVYRAGYNKGKSDVGDNYYDTLWDAYQQNGARTNYQMAFAYGWNSDAFRPKYDIKPTGGATSIFQYFGFEGDLAQRLEDCGVQLDLSKATSAHSVFNSATKITRVPEINITSAGTACTGVFAYCGQLVTVDKFVVAETNVFTSTFINCFRLVNLTIEGIIAASIDLQKSPLSKDSILSVFNALSDTVTGQTTTFNKDAVNAVFNTEEWDAMVKTKTNWTIALA